MSFILMQPEDTEASAIALTVSQSTGVNQFKVSLEGPRLQPIDAECRLCTEAECHHHSCIGEIGAGRWGIRTYPVYLW